jgi:hypothetical protein
MRQDQVALQLRGLLGRNSRARKFPETGVDSVNRLLCARGISDDCGCRVDAGLAGFVDTQLQIFPVNATQVGESCSTRLQQQFPGQFSFSWPAS